MCVAVTNRSGSDPKVVINGVHSNPIQVIRELVVSLKIENTVRAEVNKYVANISRIMKIIEETSFLSPCTFLSENTQR